jgi:hypothetical protein
MTNIKPDTTVFELDRKQPEFGEQLWQYLNSSARSACSRRTAMPG